MKGPELRSLEREHSQRVEGLCMETWDAFAALVDASVTGADLRDGALRSMHRMNGYLHQHAFAHLDSYPLRLCQGSIRERLAELRTTDSSGLDLVSCRIQIRVQTGLVSNGILDRGFTLPPPPGPNLDRTRDRM